MYPAPKCILWKGSWLPYRVFILGRRSIGNMPSIIRLPLKDVDTAVFRAVAIEDYSRVRINTIAPGAVLGIN